MTSNDGYYEVLWPRAPRQMQRRALAPRLDALAGKTIAQLWVQLFKGDLVFELLEKGIRARIPEVRFVSWREFALHVELRPASLRQRAGEDRT